MNCCLNDATVHLSYGSYCKKCFLRVIEKRVRKHIRLNNMIDLKKTYRVEDNNDVYSFCTKVLMKKLFENTPLVYDNGDIVIESMDIDTINEKFLNSLFYEDELYFGPEVNIIAVLSREDCFWYAKLNGYDCEIIENKNKNNFSLFKSINELHHLMCSSTTSPSSNK